MLSGAEPCFAYSFLHMFLGVRAACAVGYNLSMHRPSHLGFAARKGDEGLAAAALLCRCMHASILVSCCMAVWVQSVIGLRDLLRPR
jgi:hypothetical protein